MNKFLPFFFILLANPSYGKLVDPSQPEEKRVEILKAFFSPQPNTKIEFAPDELRDFNAKKSILDLRGYIQVSPPKGECLILQRNEFIPDMRVCASQPIAFVIDDFSPRGELDWVIKTGDGDFGTHLRWTSDYRVGKEENIFRDKGKDASFVVVGCTTTNTKEGGRRVHVTLHDKRKWIVAIPVAEQLLPQPKEVPNLIIYNEHKRGGFVSVEDKNKKKQQAAEKKAKRKAEGEAEEEDEEDEDDEALVSDGFPWQLFPRDAYFLEGSRLITEESFPTGSKGKCRYKYSYMPDDPGSGVLECFEVGRFKWLLLPLICLPQLKN